MINWRRDQVRPWCNPELTKRLSCVPAHAGYPSRSGRHGRHRSPTRVTRMESDKCPCCGGRANADGPLLPAGIEACRSTAQGGQRERRALTPRMPSAGWTPAFAVEWQQVLPKPPADVFSLPSQGRKGSGDVPVIGEPVGSTGPLLVLVEDPPSRGPRRRRRPRPRSQRAATSGSARYGWSIGRPRDRGAVETTVHGERLFEVGDANSGGAIRRRERSTLGPSYPRTSSTISLADQEPGRCRSHIDDLAGATAWRMSGRRLPRTRSSRPARLVSTASNSDYIQFIVGRWWSGSCGATAISGRKDRACLCPSAA